MKKGQAAMEFLMTYGWAILVVLAAIAALAYFGVLSPARFLPRILKIYLVINYLALILKGKKGDCIR